MLGKPLQLSAEQRGRCTVVTAQKHFPQQHRTAGSLGVPVLYAVQGRVLTYARQCYQCTYQQLLHLHLNGTEAGVETFRELCPVRSWLNSNRVQIQSA